MAGRFTSSRGSRWQARCSTRACTHSVDRATVIRVDPCAEWASATSAVSRSTASRISVHAWLSQNLECASRPGTSPLTEVRDVVVIGGGPAGIAATSVAAENGAHVTMIDEGSEPGGQIWRPSARSTQPRRARRWIARLDASGAEILRSTSVVDVERVGERFVVVAVSRGVGRELLATSVVLATGARERFLPFPGWTRPGVIGVGGAQALAKSGTSFRGRRVVIAGSGPLLLPVAANLSRSGAKVLLVAEQAPPANVVRFTAGLWSRPFTLAQAAALRAGFMTTPFATGTWVVAARGDTVLREVTLTDGRSMRTLSCDVLCAAFGLVPNTEIARLLGCAVELGAVVVDETQLTSVANVYCCGEPTGIGGVDLALVEGQIAGLAAAARTVPAQLVSRRARQRRDATRLDRAFSLRREVFALADADTIVCRCEDVRLGSLDRQWGIRQAKLYTRAGMGPCQGRVCGAALECLMGWPADSVRVPTQPTPCGTLTGRSSPQELPSEQGAS
jgi:NADPH-dependent 2,4-dienoyl-CoA reductase/sulfur reductase-like enzyme